MSQPFETSDQRVEQHVPLEPPQELLARLAPRADDLELVRESRQAIVKSLWGRDERVVVVVGPCSIHDAGEAIEYARELKRLATPLEDRLLVVMRTYFEKPRTTVGWKGLIYDPDLDDSHDIRKGIRLARQVMLDTLQVGLPIAAEFLDNVTPQYFSDLVSWVAIGARTSESQMHRQFASGCSMPVGFKNGTDGHFTTAIQGIQAASKEHYFPSLMPNGTCSVLKTAGNPDCHLVLRGGSETGPNYEAETVERAIEALKKADRAPRLMVDCSHGNSRKRADRQPLVLERVAQQIESGAGHVFGVMIESNIFEGNQKLVIGERPQRGISVTDACVSLDTTAKMLDRLASAVSHRS